MSHSLRSLLLQTGLIVMLVGGIWYWTGRDAAPVERTIAPESLPASAAAIDTATTTIATTTSTVASTTKPVSTATSTPKKPNIKATESASTTPEKPHDDQIKRINDPYTSAPLSSTAINDRARAALVNIVCLSGSTVKPISGSGIFIDAKGVILTNAHVAQYVLLAQSGKVNLKCTVRTGSPAVARYIPRILYIPPVWVQKHAPELLASNVTGTGEHDYALLSIAGSAGGQPLPSSYPFVPADVREAIAFVDDPVLAASYPAEFLGGIAALQSLYAVTSATSVQRMLTFTTSQVDIISLGGVIAAQSGSSGGAVLNPWGYLVGLITTMSDGKTTDARDLRAVTLSYIDRDLKVQTGASLEAMLAGSPLEGTALFARNTAPELIELLMKQVQR